MISCSRAEQCSLYMRFEGTDDYLNVGRLGYETFVNVFECLNTVRNYPKAWWYVPFAQRAAPMRNMILARRLCNPMRDM